MLGNTSDRLLERSVMRQQELQFQKVGGTRQGQGRLRAHSRLLKDTRSSRCIPRCAWLRREGVPPARDACSRIGRGQFPVFPRETRQQVLSGGPAKTKPTAEWARRPPRQLSPPAALTLGHRGEADRRWRAWLAVHAGTRVQGCDLVLWGSASPSVKLGD